MVTRQREAPESAINCGSHPLPHTSQRLYPIALFTSSGKVQGLPCSGWIRARHAQGPTLEPHIAPAVSGRKKQMEMAPGPKLTSLSHISYMCFVIIVLHKAAAAAGLRIFTGMLWRQPSVVGHDSRSVGFVAVPAPNTRQGG